MPVVTKYYCDRCGKELSEQEAHTPWVSVTMTVFDPDTDNEKKYKISGDYICRDCYEYVRDSLEALRLKLASKDFQWKEKQ